MRIHLYWSQPSCDTNTNDYQICLSLHYCTYMHCMQLHCLLVFQLLPTLDLHCWFDTSFYARCPHSSGLVEPGVSCVSVNYYRLKDKKKPHRKPRTVSSTKFKIGNANIVRVFRIYVKPLITFCMSLCMPNILAQHTNPTLLFDASAGVWMCVNVS